LSSSTADDAGVKINIVLGQKRFQKNIGKESVNKKY